MGLLRKSAGATMFLHVSLPLPQSPAHREITAAHLTRRFEHKQQREFVENAERQELISIILVPRRGSWSKNGRSPWLDCWNFSLELGPAIDPSGCARRFADRLLAYTADRICRTCRRSISISTKCRWSRSPTGSARRSLTPILSLPSTMGCRSICTWLEAARFCADVQGVIALRMMRLASGDPLAITEAWQMVSEKSYRADFRWCRAMPSQRNWPSSVRHW